MGAVLGVLGGPLGGIFALGAGILLQYLFPQKVEGPRQSDTRVSTAKYGDPIGRTIGTARIAGNYIWLKGDKIEEHKKKYRQGKGGPEVTEYSYSSTSAAVFDYDGPVDGVVRIWLDDELVYDNSTEAQAAQEAGGGWGFGTAAGMSLTFYLGTDDQLPDSRIVADKGEDYVSAWRNQVIIVMEDLDHTDIGIRMPNFEAEFSRAGPFDPPIVDPDWTSYKLTNPDYPSGFAMAASIGSTVVAFYPQQGTGGRESVYFHNLADGSYITKVPQTFPAYGIDGGIALVEDNLGVIWSRTGEAYFFNQSVGGTDFSPFFWRNHGSGVINYTPWTIARGTKIAGFIGFRIEVLETVDYALISTTLTTIGSLISPRGIAAKNDFSKFYVISNYSLDIAPAGGSATNYNLDSLYGTSFLGQVWALEAGGCVVRAENGFYKIADDGSLETSRLQHGSLSTFQLGNAVGPDSDGNIWYANWDGSTMTYYKMSSVDLSVIESVVPSPVLDPGSFPRILWFEEYGCFLRVSGSSSKTYLDFPAETVTLPDNPVLTRNQIQLADAIQDVVQLQGMSVDTTGVTKTLWGYAMKGDVTWRGVIEDLTRIFSIDHCQVDGTYKFFNRTNTSVLTVSEAHIGASLKTDGWPKKQVEENIADTLDLPNSVTITYPSFDASYRLGSQRMDIPLDTSDSLSEMSVATNTVLEDDEAAQAADVLLREARESQDFYEFDLPPYYARLHPGVIITVPLEGGATMKMVVEEIEDDLILKVKAHKRTIDYASDAIGVTTPNIVITRITDAEPVFLPLDTNMIRDTADDDNDGFYISTYWSGTIPPRGVNIWRSLNGGDTYDAWASFVSFSCVCELLTPLEEELSPYIPHPTAYFDFRNISKGIIPESVSSEEWLDGILGCAIQNSTGEWEIVLVLTITELSTNNYRAEGLVRGYRGTETLTGGHAIGDKLIWLDVDFIARSTDGQVGVTQKFVAELLGVPFDDTNPLDFTNTAKSLKPYRPVLISGTRDTGVTEDLTVVWERQTRWGGSWIDGTEDVPLNETSEEYEVEYYEGVTLLRTRTGLTTPTDTYTLTEYTADAGGSPTVIPELNVVVYQISQEYTIAGGRGYPGEDTI